MSYLLTSESVTSGHPDKLCDYISDSILDECLILDPDARVAVEVFTKGLSSDNGVSTKSYIVIGGEVSIKKGAVVDYEKIARRSAAEIGYDSTEVGMSALDKELCEVIVLIGTQSREISQGVSQGEGLHTEQGAGDQGIMYGFATDESEKFDSLVGSFMPLTIILAHKLTLGLTEARKLEDLNWIRPDGKSQVTIAYDEMGIPLHIDTIIMAVQHDDLANKRFSGNVILEREFIINEIKEKIIYKLMPEELIKEDIKIIINGTGRFMIGGPQGDAGLTGRKIIVDTYGGIGRHGGGAFSGKDPSKVDRSGAYMARWVSKHIVASGLAKICEVQISYAIGIANPISINVGINTFGSSNFSNRKIENLILTTFNFKPLSIIDTLNLKRPIYSKTSSGGHFGRNNLTGDFTWEKLDPKIISSLKNCKFSEK